MNDTAPKPEDFFTVTNGGKDLGTDSKPFVDQKAETAAGSVPTLFGEQQGNAATEQRPMGLSELANQQVAKEAPPATPPLPSFVQNVGLTVEPGNAGPSTQIAPRALVVPKPAAAGQVVAQQPNLPTEVPPPPVLPAAQVQQPQAAPVAAVAAPAVNGVQLQELFGSALQQPMQPAGQQTTVADMGADHIFDFFGEGDVPDEEGAVAGPEFNYEPDVVEAPRDFATPAAQAQAPATTPAANPNDLAALIMAAASGQTNGAQPVNQPIPQPVNPPVLPVTSKPEPAPIPAAPIIAPGPGQIAVSPATLANPAFAVPYVPASSNTHVVAPDDKDPKVRNAKLYRFISDQITAAQDELGLAILRSPSATKPADSYLHKVIWEVRWNTQRLTELTPHQLCQMEAVLAAHQATVQGLENEWQARYQYLGRQLDELILRRRENYVGKTMQEKELACLDTEPDLRQMRSHFLLAQAMAKLLEEMGETFRHFENGLKRIVDLRQAEYQKQMGSGRQM